MPRNTVFISGIFSFVHPGHYRLLEYARRFQTHVTIGLLADQYCIDETLDWDNRRLNLMNTGLVDEVINVSNDILLTIQDLQPSMVLKGEEFRDQINPELTVIESYGGSLIFGSGSFHKAEVSELEGPEKTLNFDFDAISVYLKTQSLSAETLREAREAIGEVSSLVLGDTILDRYVDCTAVGMSQEDPLVVFKPYSDKEFIGGAGIVAAHASNVGHDTVYFSAIGEDDECERVVSILDFYKINHCLVPEKLRRTTYKTRFRHNNVTRFRLNNFDDSYILDSTCDRLFESLMDNLDRCDVLLLSDFAFGVMRPDLVTNLLNEARTKGMFVGADCQASSTVGNLGKYKGVNLITPTEYEARLFLDDFVSGLNTISRHLLEAMTLSCIFTTMGERGANAAVYSADGLNQFSVSNFQIPAVANECRDVAGAGDAFFVGSSFALAKGFSPSIAGLCGAILAGGQVSSVGNTPLSKSKVLNLFDAVVSQC